MRCDAKLFICAQLRMCAEDGESQTLLIISALIRMSALKNILEGLQLAHSRYSPVSALECPDSSSRVKIKKAYFP